jgi:cytosine/adenosine deaminase-related metal-dependent hydrolase
MEDALLIRNVRPMGGASADVRIGDGCIKEISPTIDAGGVEIRILEGDGQLLLPGFVNAHAHIDKNLLGLGWHTNRLPGTRIGDFVDYERQVRRELNLSARIQSALEVQAAVAAGTTHIRSHVDIDTDAGLTHLEGVMATRDAFKDSVTMQLVAFPQSGMLVRPGTVELLEEAVKMGVECIGGLDPSTVDRDPVRHLDTIFDIAERHGAEVDIHLHEPGRLGGFAIELIAERTRVLGMQGRVTISHAFCLGMIDFAYLDQLIDLLHENSITIMSLGSGLSPFPPIKRLFDAGVALCTGTDGVHDTWGAYNSVDMLERLKLLGYRCGFRKDEDRAMLFQIATYGGAKVFGDRSYGLTPGCRADFVIVPGETLSEAIVRQPPRTYVVKTGRLIAAGGKCL